MRRPTLEQLFAAVQASLTPDLLEPQYRERNRSNPMFGHCFVATGALWFLLRDYYPRLTLRPYSAKDRAGITHWWLQDDDARIVDLTADQYLTVGLSPPYSDGRGRGMMSRKGHAGELLPSRRMATVVRRARSILGLQ